MAGSRHPVSERAWEGLALRTGFRRILRLHQGVSLQIHDRDNGRELLRFDCYDEVAHYHYDPAGRNRVYWLDGTVRRSSLDWAFDLIGRALPQMASAAGLPRRLPAAPGALLRDLAADAVEAERRHRDVLVHFPGHHLIAAGDLVFGLGWDPQADGVSLRVLRRVGGELEEMVGFDCHRDDPHYHYGPRRLNAVIPIDPVVTPDPLDWVCGLIRAGRLGAMLARSGYPELADVGGSEATRRAFARRVEPIARALEHGGADGMAAAW